MRILKAGLVAGFALFSLIATTATFACPSCSKGDTADLLKTMSPSKQQANAKKNQGQTLAQNQATSSNAQTAAQPAVTAKG